MPSPFFLSLDINLRIFHGLPVRLGEFRKLKMLHTAVIPWLSRILHLTVLLLASINVLNGSVAHLVKLGLVGEVDRYSAKLICFRHMSLIIDAHLLIIALRKQLRIVWLGWLHLLPCRVWSRLIRCESLLFEHQRLSFLVLIGMHVQPAGALLELEDAPRDPWELTLRVGPEYAKRAQKTRDLNLLFQLVEAAPEQTIASALPKAQALAFGGQNALYIKTAGNKYAPIHRLKVLNANTFVEILAEILSNLPSQFFHDIGSMRLSFSPLRMPQLILWHDLNTKELWGEPLIETIEIKEEDNGGENCIQGAKKPTNISKQVK